MRSTRILTRRVRKNLLLTSFVYVDAGYKCKSKTIAMFSAQPLETFHSLLAIVWVCTVRNELCCRKSGVVPKTRLQRLPKYKSASLGVVLFQIGYRWRGHRFGSPEVGCMRLGDQLLGV